MISRGKSSDTPEARFRRSSHELAQIGNVSAWGGRWVEDDVST